MDVYSVIVPAIPIYGDWVGFRKESMVAIPALTPK